MGATRSILSSFLLTLLMGAGLLFPGVVTARTLPQQEAPGSGQIRYTVPSRMNVRRGPGISFAVVTTVPAGTKVTIYGTSEAGNWSWGVIEGIDEVVWLSVRLLSDAPPPTEVLTPPAPASVTEPEAAVNGPPLAITRPTRMNVRRGPGLEYEVVRSVVAGTRALITGLGPQGQWWQVSLDDSEEPLWIFRSLTQVTGSTDEIPQRSEDEIPPRPAPKTAAAPPAPAAPAAVAVAAPAPTGGAGFGYGVQAHMIHTGQAGQVMAKTQEMGFNWVKQQIEWKIFESQPGQYGFGDISPIVAAANERGINLLFSVVNAPDWAREPNFDGSVGGPPQDPQTMANFVGALAREYCGTSLKAIEVWNEQNLHYEWGNLPLDPGAYVRLLAPSYAAIKANCPSMQVISGALTPAGDNGNLAMDDFRYLEAMFQAGLARYADGIGAHPSGYNVPPNVGFQQACDIIQQTGNRFNGACDTPHHSWSFRSTMEGYRNIAVVYGASHLPIWPTEFGWASQNPPFHPAYMYAADNDQDEQARWTVEAYQMMRSWGWVGPAFLWNLNFRVVADGTEKAQWGIVHNDWRPLPVFYALRDMPK